VPIYARVSSDQQTQQGTIDSQVAALRQRVQADGLVLEEELCFVEDGYSGSTLVRPALERLRDIAWSGGFQRLYVHSPDRLARKYAWQVLLVEELQRAGVELVFLNRTIGISPEEDLLLQMQGMIAEYERAKIMERSRRGKRHAARRGSVSVLCGAPYGYRYVSKHSAGGQAYYQVIPEQARVVKQIFVWVGRDRLSLRKVCRRLQQQGIPSAKGKPVWDREVVGKLDPPLLYADETAYVRRLASHEQSLKDALTLFEVGRRQFARVLRALPDEAFDRRGMHNRRGVLTVGGSVKDYIKHVDHHLAFLVEKRVRLGNPRGSPEEVC
jgi:site-specific DNA recombinase